MKIGNKNFGYSAHCHPDPGCDILPARKAGRGRENARRCDVIGIPLIGMPKMAPVRYIKLKKRKRIYKKKKKGFRSLLNRIRADHNRAVRMRFGRDRLFRR